MTARPVVSCFPLGAVDRAHARSDGWEDSPLCDEGVYLTRNALWTGGRGTGGDLTRHYDTCPRCSSVQAANRRGATDG